MTMIDPVTLKLVTSALDAASLRHVAIAQNIANASVPGARAAEVSFERELDHVRDALRTGQALSVDDIPSAQWEEMGPEVSIQLDEQAAALSSNSMHYQVLLKAMSRHMSLLSVAVNDGRR